jgi:hypothetical protein
MKAAIVKDGVVVNVVMLNHLNEHQGAINGESANIGDAWDGDKFIRPVIAQSPNAPILASINALERSQTARRMREAVLSEDGALWLAVVSSQIAALRAQLK